MSVCRTRLWAILGVSAFVMPMLASGQIVINEIVKEERTAGAGAVNPDTREFVELYNAGTAAMNIGGWTLSTYRLSGTLADAPGTYFFTDTIQDGTMLQPGEFFVLGNLGGVPEVDQDLGSGIELFEDLRATVMELRSGPRETAPIVDAVAYDRFFANASPPAGITFAQPTPEQAAQIGRGVWGQVQSYNITESANFKRLSLSRYQDGRDSNSNGIDFGFLPMTPGASNNLPQNAAHVVPDVSMAAPGTPVAAYHFGFVPARVIDPGTVDALGSSGSAINPSIIAEPPQGGNAIVMWDETGGGNSAYSKELVNEFDIYAYLDATPLAIGSGDWELESTVYGIGTTEPLFGNPNPSSLIPSGGATTNTQNSSTGIGWMYQRFQQHPDQGGGNVAKLSLIDFGEGGNSVPTGTELGWEIVAEFELAAEDTGWHRLGVDYDPATGGVVATFGDQTRTFTTDTDLLGTFYIGYREALTAVPGNNASRTRPPTFVQFVDDSMELMGDYNSDGHVDAADYVVWRSTDGSPDGYNLWRANFGRSATGAGALGAAVPEPGTIMLAWFGLIAGTAMIGRGHH